MAAASSALHAWQYDFNCVENIDLDSLPKKNKSSANKRFLIEFCQKLKLVDPFRELYPTKKEFTHRSAPDPRKPNRSCAYGRLDWF